MAQGPAFLAGPESLRAGRERRMLAMCLLAAPVALGIAFRLTGINIAQAALIVIGGLVFVAFARGRLLGDSVRLGEGQLPEIHRITHDLASRLGIETPHVFVRDDAVTAIGAVGTSEPYSLILSSQYLEHLSPPELRFLIARELAHIAAGHTRVTSLLSASGRENPFVAFVFGAWLRRTEYTADRIALALAPGIDEAMRAIAISTFHAVGRRVDLTRLVDQQRDLDAEPALRIGEWSSATPYATSRFLALGNFSQTALFGHWRERFARGDTTGTAAAERVVPVAPGIRFPREHCAPIASRLGAISIDGIVVAAISNVVQFPQLVRGEPSARSMPGFAVGMLEDVRAIQHVSEYAIFFVFFVYSVAMVALLGQTLGMIVMDVRVVTTTYGRPGPLQIAWRYLAAFFASTFGWTLVAFFLRVHPHDWLSRTRVIRTRAVAPVPAPSMQGRSS